jgi:hypothetical protein
MKSPRFLGLFLLGIGLLAAPAQGAPLDRYLPPDAQWIVGINVKSLLDSALFKKYGQEPLKLRIKKDKEAEELKRVFGFDPYKDIHHAIVAGTTGEQPNVLVVIHGKFDHNTIEPILDQVSEMNPDALKIGLEKTLRFYEFNLPDQPAPAFAAFTGDDTLILSNSQEYLFHCIARANDRKATRLEKGMQALVNSADPKKTLWIAAKVPDAAKQKLADNPQAAAFAQKVKYISGTVMVTDGVNTDINLQMSDQRTAEELRSFLETVRPFLSKAINDNKEMGAVAGPVFDAIKVLRVRNGVSLSSKITGSTVERAVRRWKK